MGVLTYSDTNTFNEMTTAPPPKKEVSSRIILGIKRNASALRNMHKLKPRKTTTLPLHMCSEHHLCSELSFMPEEERACWCLPVLLNNTCSTTVSVKLVKPESLSCGSSGDWLWFLTLNGESSPSNKIIHIHLTEGW